MRCRHTLLAALCLACSRQPPLEWHEEDGYRWADLPVSRSGRIGFVLLPPERTGIDATNHLAEERLLENQALLNGSGVALGDVDGDGLVDIYFSRLDSANLLYKNLGNWKFRDVTAQAGVAAPDRFSTGAAFADADGDGDLDLFVTALGGPNAYYENDGSGTFTERTAEAGLASSAGSTTMAFADVDGDGDLDLYVASYKVKSVRDLYALEELAFERVVERVNGETVVRAEFREHYGLMEREGETVRFEYGEPDRFYLNDGSGRFSEVEFTSGSFLDEAGNPLPAPFRDWGLTARFHDVDGDGDPDLYVCNDFETPDRFWLNDGTGRFRLIDSLALRTTSAATMAVDFADIDRDGDADFLLLDMLDVSSRRRKTQTLLNLPELPTIGEIATRPQLPRNTLQLNRGDGTFAEIAYLAGVEASGWSWSAVFVDVDLDGFEDALISNGYAYDFLDMDSRDRIGRTMSGRQGAALLEDRTFLLQHPPLHTRNVLYRNNGDLTFTEIAEAWGFGIEEDIAQGMATADLDGDGDLDVVINRMGRPAAIYRNEGGGNRVAVRLVARPPNTQGIGAKIRVRGGAVPEQEREVTLGAYLSTSEPLSVFATGDARQVDITVGWRSGRTSVIERAAPNRIYEVFETGAADFAPPAPPPTPRTLFVETTPSLEHSHAESQYDDRRRQVLLRHLLSHLGPGVTWYDVDADGDDDLLITTGNGGTLRYYRNDGGRLRPVTLRANPSRYDQTAVIPVPDGAGGTDILVGQMNYEAVSPAAALEAASVLRYQLGDVTRAGAPAPRVSDAVPGAVASTGPLAVADYDLDGDLDLFVGGRVSPARYPTPTSSRLFVRTGDRFSPDTVNSALLESIGMVSSAVFSDIDGDGDPDLLLALDWGPITLLRNDGGRFTDVTAAYGLADYTSMWNGITTGDLDGDGRLDIVATSWGRNTTLDADSEHPLRSYYGDFDGNGMTDIVDARFDPRLGGVAPLRSAVPLMIGMPALRRRITSHAEYANQTMGDIFGPTLGQAAMVQATTLEHAVWLNRGDRLERVPLPVEAQAAPAFYVGVADVDGDGAEDVVLAQNFSFTERETGPYNAGRGLILRGDGHGGLTPMLGQESGLDVYGDQRGAALSDFDADGRVDLAVSQNGAPTRVFRNVGATPGVRVRLRGGPGNPYAIGAQVRLVYASRRGPVREVHGGSGYWSMDGLEPVLGGREDATAVWVRWPGGTESEVQLDPGAHEVTIPMRSRERGAGSGTLR